MDGQHIIATHVTKPAVPLSWQAPGEIKHTLSRMKASKGPEREYILLPLVDSRMRDMSQAYADLKAQANPTAGFCLAAPRNPKRLVDGPVDRRHQCSYTTAIKMIREFAKEFQQEREEEQEERAVSKAGRVARKERERPEEQEQQDSKPGHSPK